MKCGMALSMSYAHFPLYIDQIYRFSVHAYSAVQLTIQYACISNEKGHNCEKPCQSALLGAVDQPSEMRYIPPGTGFK